MPNLMDSGGGLKRRVSDGMIRCKVSGLCSVRNVRAESVYPRSALRNEWVATSLCQYIGNATAKQQNDMDDVM